MLQMVRGLVQVWHQRDVTSIMKHEIVVDIEPEGFQMRIEMLSDSEDSYISELSDSDHEERKVEEEQSSVRIASSVCSTNVTSQIKSRGILTARFECHIWDKIAQLQALIKSSALIQNISNFEIVYFKQYIFQPYRKKFCVICTLTAIASFEKLTFCPWALHRSPPSLLWWRAWNVNFSKLAMAVNLPLSTSRGSN